MSYQDELVTIDDALRLSTDAAQIVLEAGGETYRAEDVMRAIASALGALSPESFATPTGFMASCNDSEGHNHAVVKRIRKRQINLQKIAEVNAIAREAVSGAIGKDEIEKKLCAADTIGAYPKPIAALGAAFVTLFFCLIFGGVWNDAVAAGFVGIVMAKLMTWLGSMRLSDFFSNIVGGGLAAGFAVMCSLVGLVGNKDAMIIGAIMLLVPGVTIVNAIRDIIAGDLLAGVARVADAFISAAGISIGVGGALHVANIFGVYIR